MKTGPADDRYRMLVEGVRDYGIFMLDPTGHIVSWNAGAALIKGYEASEIIGQHFSRFYEAEAIERGWPDYELLKAAELGRFEDENWRLRKDGSRFWAQVVITAIRDTDGTLLGFSKVTRDLTERRRNEEALRQSEERFRLLVDGVRDYAIMMLDVNGHVRTWNAGAQQMKGYTADEIIGRHFSCFYPQEAIDRGWPAHELAVAAVEGRFEEEGWRVRRDGSRFWASVIVSPLRSPDGKLTGFAKITRDITDRQRLEALVKSTREMTEFLAMLSHELRNPLAPIRNAVAVLELQASADPTVMWSREVIGRQATHLARLVDDLLDVSRMTSGKISIRRDILDMRDVVAHSVEACHALMVSRQHVLEVVLPEQSAHVRGDATRLTQVTTNLLNNAIKYTPPGGHITVSLDIQGGHSVLRVADDGMGLRPDQLEQVFDLFAQGEQSLARSDGGLGVGLTLVRRLVELHDGNVAAQSAGIGCGSTFDVRLPLASAEEPLSTHFGANAPAHKNEKSRHRILVVDDSRDSASSMAAMLTLKGHSVRCGYDSAEALAAVREFSPELALLDIGLPGMNGYELAQAIRAIVGREAMVLCAMTGYGQNEDRRRSRDAGFDHHLVKPVDLNELEAVINALPQIVKA